MHGVVLHSKGLNGLYLTLSMILLIFEKNTERIFVHSSYATRPPTRNVDTTADRQNTFKICMVEMLLLINLRTDKKYIFEFQSRTCKALI
jgi:hypothetical protein